MNQQDESTPAQVLPREFYFFGRKDGSSEDPLKSYVSGVRIVKAAEDAANALTILRCVLRNELQGASAADDDVVRAIEALEPLWQRLQFRLTL